MAGTRIPPHDASPPKFRDFSIGTIFVCAVISVSTVFLGAWAVLEYLTTGTRMRADLDADLELDLSRLASSLALNLWDVNYAQADAICLSSMGNREIASIEVFPSVQGHSPRVFTRDEEWKAVKAAAPLKGKNTRTASRQIMANGRLVGRVRVTMTTDFLEKELRAVTLRLGLAVGILDIMLIVALYLLLRVLVIKPLIEMGAYAAEVSDGRRAVPRPDLPGRELSKVSDAIGRMVALLESRYLDMEASEHRFKVLFEHAPDAILEFRGESGHILEANAAALGLLGPGVIDRQARVDQLFQGDDGARELREALATGMRGDSASFEAKLRTASGGETLCAVNLTPLPSSGSERALRLSIVDIGEKRNLEERLRHAERMDAIGQLAGGVAHDFNNQLGGILGYADLLSERVPEGKEREWVEGIIKSATRATGLTRQLLAYARRGKFQRETVDLHALCRETADFLDRSIDKRIRVYLDLAAEESRVEGDVSQLQNALLNLAINARDAMPEGGSLRFSTRQSTLAGLDPNKGMNQVPCIEVCVSDSGVGMGEETKRHLFEPFFTTKGPGKGTGLGLAAVYGTVQNHHGAIRVESELGKGTFITILLPLSGQDSRGTQEPEPCEPQASLGGAVVFIDDEEVIREVGGRMLESMGYEPILCPDADSAYKAFETRAGKVELVILDLILPGSSGREIFSRLRAIDPGVRVLIASGYAVDGEAQALLDAGAAGFIQKPFLSAQLKAALNRALGKRTDRLSES